MADHADYLLIAERRLSEGRNYSNEEAAVYAQLAVAAELRTANLIAMAAHARERSTFGVATAAFAQAAARLGLDNA